MIKEIKNIIGIAIIAIMSFTAILSKPSYNERLMKPINLKVNLLENPYGVEKDKLAFSWGLQCFGEGKLQSAYRIVISLRKSNLNNENYVYDSGWVESQISASVKPAGIYEILEDNQLYWWKVQVKDSEGNISDFSEAQPFVTAVGNEWQSTTGIWGSADQKYVFLRAPFYIWGDIEKAILNVTATSPQKSKQYVYNIYVNGKLVGLGPNTMNNGKFYYDTYDITEYVNNEENIISSVNYTEETGAFLCQITLFYKDGTKEIVINSGSNAEQWKYFNGNEVYGAGRSSIGTSYYIASSENIDGTLYPYGWNEREFDDSEWKNTIGGLDFTSLGELTPVQTDSIKRFEEHISSITQINEDTYLIDLGKEIIGGISLALDVPSETLLNIKYGEELNQDGSVRYKLLTGNVYEEEWKLVCGGQQIDGIGMKTFRYVAISGCPIPITSSNIKALSIRQDFYDDESYFNSSNTLLNDIYDFTKYTIKATNQNLYVDCQNRERNVYEGDTYINMLSSFSFEDDYSLAGISLDCCINNPTWPAEYQLYTIIAAWEYYMYTGDISCLEDNYENLKNKLYDSCYDNKTGLMKKPEKKLLIDWPLTERDGYDESGSYYNTVFNAVCVGAYDRMADISGELGKNYDESFYRQRANDIRRNMIGKLYDKECFRFFDGMDKDGKISYHQAQHATAYALAYGIYDSQEMADNMACSIEADGGIKMSVYGAFTLLNGLYQSDNGTVARKLMSNPYYDKDRHTWAYMMYEQKATITAEAWSSKIKPNMSMAHPWGSAPASEIVRGMFGIRPLEAGFSKFQVKLQPGGIREASILVPTIKGGIKTSYYMTGTGDLIVKIIVPGNTIASVYVPTNNKNSNILKINGVDKAAIRYGNYLTIDLEPGNYEIYSESCIYEDNSELVSSTMVLDIEYKTHVQNYGWVKNREGIGTAGLAKCFEDIEKN